MIELKLDGHTVFQIDVVSQYKDKLRQQDAQRNEHLAEVATLRDERDALKRHNEEQRKALYALELRVGREPHQPLQECKPLTEQEPVAEIVSDENGTLSTRWNPEWTPNAGDKLYTAPPAPQARELSDDDRLDAKADEIRLLRAELDRLKVQKPVAWLDTLNTARPDTVTDLMYCSVSQHDRGDHLKYIPVYLAAGAQPASAKPPWTTCPDCGYDIARASAKPLTDALKQALESAANYIDVLGGVSKAYRMELANYTKHEESAKPLPEWDNTEPNSKQGLYQKFIIQRVDGSDAALEKERDRLADERLAEMAAMAVWEEEP